MSIIHVNQIKSRVCKVFKDKIDLADLKVGGNHIENFFLSRALAAYSIHYLANADLDTAAAAVTDGGDDNGLDAIFYQEAEKRLFLVQSKWIHNGKGEPDSGEVKKFLAGVIDLFNFKFENFNQKVQAKRDLIANALDDPNSRFTLVIVFTGNSQLAVHSSRDLENLRSELNDTSDIIDICILNQQKLHTSLTIGLLGDPIVIDVTMKSWGKITSPYPAYYGQVTASQIGHWWTKFHSRLFAKNLRGILGDTDVNVEIKNTLKFRREHFWYFNNGITIVAKKITKTMAYGSETEVGVFHCEDVSVVNGAQTVGTIGRFSESGMTDLETVYVPIRIISLEKAPANFGEQVTRTNNRQNRIENRDFVTLDPEQNRIKHELVIDGISYNISRSEKLSSGDKTFDLVESTTALACASGKAHLVVLSKKEIGRLWEDIENPPYKELFNKTVSGMYIWRCVRVQRMVENSLVIMQKKKFMNSSEEGIIFHGNRILAAIVFSKIGKKNLENYNFDFDYCVTKDVIDEYIVYSLESVKNLVL